MGSNPILSATYHCPISSEFLHEFPFFSYKAYAVMEQDDDGWWRFPEHNGSFPQLFSIRATR